MRPAKILAATGLVMQIALILAAWSMALPSWTIVTCAGGTAISAVCFLHVWMAGQ